MRDETIPFLICSDAPAPLGRRLGPRALRTLAGRAREEGPAVLVVCESALPAALLALGDRAEDAGGKHRSVQLSRRLLRREGIPVIRGGYRSDGQMARSIRVFLERARRTGDRNFYLIAVDEGTYRRFAARPPPPRAGSPDGDSPASGGLAPLPAAASPRVERELVKIFPGVSPAIRMFRDLLARAAGNREPVFLAGEVGAGKDHAARALSRLREDHHFHLLPAGALAGGKLTRTLTDGGYLLREYLKESPAPSGRDRGAPLHQERRALYLDDVSLLSPRDQVEMRVRLSAGPAHAPANRAGLIVSTSVDLRARVAEGAFDAKLYYFLLRHLLHLPSLRERPEDIPHLVHSLWRDIGAEREKPGLPDNVVDLLAGQPWPGNVRELKSLLLRFHDLYGRVPAPAGAREEQMRGLLAYGGRALQSPSRHALATRRVECLDHLRRTDEFLLGCDASLRPLFPRGKPAGPDLVLPTLLRLLGTLDLLCQRRLHFGSHATFQAVAQLRASLSYLQDLLSTAPARAGSFWHDEITRQLQTLPGVLAEESGRMMRAGE